MPVLAAILAETRARVSGLAGRAGEFARLARAAPPGQQFLQRPGTLVGVIAEVKRRSPSQGAIRADLDPVSAARSYQRAGAVAVSVLTEQRHFGGSVEDLRQVAAAISIPVLRKDFIIDTTQVLEARIAGASAVLLIARILERGQLLELAAAIREWRMTPLIEVHAAKELDMAFAADPGVLGVNARNLDTLEMNTGDAEEIMRHVPPSVTLIAESGVQNRQDVERLAAAGADYVLVGTSVVRDDDPEKAVRVLTGVRRVGR